MKSTPHSLQGTGDYMKVLMCFGLQNSGVSFMICVLREYRNDFFVVKNQR
jgi:hypothetical protein